MTDKQIASWDDLAAAAAAQTKIIELPALSAALGKPVHAKIRQLGGIELVKAMNFPMDAINAAVASGQSAETAAMEQAQTMDMDSLMASAEAVTKACLVDPDPAGGDIMVLKSDFLHIFTEACALAMPKGAVAQAAAFRPDRE